MASSEITELEDEENFSYYPIEKEAERKKIRQIISYQKSLYFSSSSSSSFSYSGSSFSSPRKSSSLLGLMKEGSTSLRRLFDMEHTSLGDYFKDYRGSPITKPILLWGSDSDHDAIHEDPWMVVRQRRPSFKSRIFEDQSAENLSSKGGSFDDHDNINEESIRARIPRIPSRRLTRTKSYKRLPRFVPWRFRGFRIRFRMRVRLRRLRVMICGRTRKL